VSETGGEITDTTPFVVAHSEAEAQEKANARFGQEVKLKQDPDVLDTWFSSGLWPFSTMGWPEETLDLKTYYPTTTLVTGFDIIFFWVARMTLMAGHFTGQMPFETVYIHGLVRDENNKKMSKSANNGIDPLILIGKYGTDALRYALIREVAGAGQDIRLEYNRKTDESASVEASRNFANKLWNAARFVMMNLDGKTPQELGSPLDLLGVTEGGLELSDRWILSRFHQVVRQTNDYLDTYGLGEAAKGLYDFIWGDFCDWYIEMVKSRLRLDASAVSRRVAQQTLAYVLEGILKLLHPFMPHITEEIWQTLYGRSISPDGLLVNATDKNAKASPLVLALQSYPDSLYSQSGDWEYLSEVEGTEQDSQLTSIPNPQSSTPNSESASLDKSLPQIQHIWNQGARFLSELPRNMGQFFSNYQQPLIVVGLLFVAIVALKVVLATISAINDIPLVSSTFELVGLGYTIWFIYRYLLTSKNRQELVAATRLLKAQIVGKEGTDPLTASNTQDAMLNTQDSAFSNRSSKLPPSTGKATPIDLELEQQFELLIGTIRTIRNLRAEADVKPGVKVQVILQSGSSAERQILEAGQSYIQDLAKVETLTITPALETGLKMTMAGVVGTVQVLVPLAGVIDVDARRAKLEKDLGKVEAEIKSLSGRLANPNFVSKAAPEVVQGAKEALAEAQKQAEILRDRLKRLTDNS
jgi:valyl-tRNA synthetase